jgi:hypothetical protein
MSRTAFLKWLRIVWTVVCGIACLALMLLWISSYDLRDRAVVPLTDSKCLRVASSKGTLQFETYGPCMGTFDSGLAVVDLSVAWNHRVERNKA